MKQSFWLKLEQFLLEWHCIMEGHVWYRIKSGFKCARCRKIRTIATKARRIK
jgi:hypothetical protein